MKLKIRETSDKRLYSRELTEETYVRQYLQQDSEHPNWKLYGYLINYYPLYDTPILLISTDKKLANNCGGKLAELLHKYGTNREKAQSAIDKFRKKYSDHPLKTEKSVAFISDATTEDSDLFEKIDSNTCILYLGEYSYYVHIIGSATFK